MRVRLGLVAIALLAAACGGGGDATPLDAAGGEGFAAPPAPRLDVVGLGGPIEVEGGACIVRYEVDPAGRVNGQRFHVTLHLGAQLGGRADLGAALADDACAADRTAVVEDVRAALGNVDPSVFEFSYVGTNGARYRLD